MVRVIQPDTTPTEVPYPTPGLPAKRWPALTLLAATVLGEAEGESYDGKRAVAHVVMTRVADERWPDDVHGVILQPWQFSCWNSSSPRIPVMLNPRQHRVTSATWVECYRAAAEAMFFLRMAPCPGANHYCRTDVVERTSWAAGRPSSGVIGHHSFFRL